MAPATPAPRPAGASPLIRAYALVVNNLATIVVLPLLALAAVRPGVARATGRAA